jgi:outer membrane protein
MTRMTVAVTLKTLLVVAVLSTQLAYAQAGQTVPPPDPQKPPATPPATQKPPVPVPFPADSKFAFVSLQFVVSESRFGKQGSEELKKFQENRTAQLSALEKEIEGLKSKLGTQRTLMNAEAQRNMENQIINLQRKFQFEGESAQADIQRLNADLLDKFQAKVLPIIEAIRKERNLLVIFAQQDDPGGLAVIAFDPGLDLSAEVVKRLDAIK